MQGNKSNREIIELYFQSIIKKEFLETEHARWIEKD